MRLPPGPFVWLALEGGAAPGSPGHAVRLWGLALDEGSGEPRLEAITAGGEDADGRLAWRGFVARAGEVMERHPDARWVHYSHLEQTTIQACAAEHGAPAGFLERLEEALFELLSRGLRGAVRLPFDACSLRDVAAHAGFRWGRFQRGRSGLADPRRVPAAGAGPVEPAGIRAGITGSCAEHLMAMRAVWRWMVEQGPRGYCG